jgi:hypothetical protein
MGFGGTNAIKNELHYADMGNTCFTLYPAETLTMGQSIEM